MLYQLSYSRIELGSPSLNPEPQLLAMTPRAKISLHENRNSERVALFTFSAETIRIHLLGGTNMKALTVISALALTLGSTMAFSEDMVEKSNIRTVQMRSCDFWSYNSEVRGHVCSGYPSSVSVAEAWSTNDEVRRLKDRIADLERRLEALEAGNQ